MTKPRALLPGDLIAVVSPASSISRDRLERGTDLLEEHGFRVQLGEHVLAQTDYLAGSDEDRAADLMAAFRNPEAAAVLCSRGGYGCARLLPLLDLDEMAASGKMFLGFSDISTLHFALNRRGLVTIHSPMLLSFNVEREPWVLESFLNVLTGKDPIVANAPKGETIVAGQAEGVVTGGCLCLITDSLATPDSIDMQNKIVLIEDVDENPHRVDAMLTHLLNTGQIQQAAGIVVGEMTSTDDREDATIGKRPWRDIVIERLAPLGKPLVVNFPFGHCRGMLSLPLGIRACLNADEGTLQYTESAWS